MDLFRFFKETAETNASKTDFYKSFYQGTLRALLVILHDFPEFLVQASFLLVENIPEKFNQVKSIIFSAFPKSTPPPNPRQATTQVFLS